MIYLFRSPAPVFGADLADLYNLIQGFGQQLVNGGIRLMEARVGIVKGSNGREWLRLRWTYAGERVNLSLGIPNDRPNMAIAKKIAARITSDLANDIYDHANHKATYGLKKIGNKPRVISCSELFEKFSEQRLLKAESSRDRYRAIAGWINKLLPMNCDRVDARIAGNFLARLEEGVCGNTAKAYISIISACWNWAGDSYDLTSPNPWLSIILRIKGSRVREIKPFSSGEIKKILEAFYQHPHYRFYGDFVRFLINTGARPGEVIALTWGDFNANFSEVSISKSYSKGKLRHTTKTGVNRVVAIAPVISRMLGDRKRSLRLSPKDGDLVFPAIKGSYLNLGSFTKKAWKNRLKSAGLRLVNLYTIRHTAISHALYEGEDIKAVAQQAGNSPRVVDATYRHSLEKVRSVFKGF